MAAGLVLVSARLSWPTLFLFAAHAILEIEQVPFLCTLFCVPVGRKIALFSNIEEIRMELALKGFWGCAV